MHPALDLEDAIAATATAPGPGVRGIVRLSGPDAWRIATTGFEPDSPLPAASSRAVQISGGYRLSGLRPMVPARITLWSAPRTYTGQELAEVHAPGSPPLLSRLLAHLLASGARPARPGEFTLRAFLSGRIDLTQAEAVLGVIDARDPRRLDAALEQLAGGLAGPIASLRDRLLDLLAHLEAGLDFVDEADVDPIGRAKLASDLASEAAALDALAGRLDRRDRIDASPRVVLTGPPNAGKSRLFNSLLEDDHAIVSAQAGTTRDTLAAPCRCDGLLVELVDTAGVDASLDAIAADAQSRASAEIDRADLILSCSSTDAPPTAFDDDRVLRVWTKGDLAPPPASDPSWISTSAATTEGLTDLKRAIARTLRSREAEPVSPTSARCRDALARVSESLRAAATAMAVDAGDELIAFDLRSALDDLAEVTGAVVADDVLDRIFSRFCIGK